MPPFAFLAVRAAGRAIQFWSLRQCALLLENLDKGTNALLSFGSSGQIKILVALRIEFLFLEGEINVL